MKENVIIFCLLVLSLVVIVILLAIIKKNSSNGERRKVRSRETAKPEIVAGKYGEKIASAIIKSVLNEEDNYFTNVTVTNGEQKVELDNLIINRRGVYIIEVKNYTGEIYGEIHDDEWEKLHISRNGNAYVKKIKNPIKQVKRQIGITSAIFNRHRIRVWVYGYVLMLNNNSPVSNKFTLNNAKEIDNAIHNKGKCNLDKKTIDAIKRVLKV